ncbi:MAG: HlyD family efflux transporter periplasmic adaptor subunit [Robiginitomaculum sp.]|nr:HlyD family efflux transporter periplasmic adaptor subunit [Robiginitomaculum sp.]
MTTPLFRKQSISHATNRLDGKVVLLSPVSIWLLGGFLIAILGFALTFALTASYARKEAVVGWIVPEAGLVRPVAQNGGLIQNLMVKVGDQVTAGDVLASVQLASVSTQGNTGAILAQALQEQSKAAKRSANNRILRLDAENTRLRRQQNSLKKELREAHAQIKLQKDRVALAKSSFGKAENIFKKGHLSKVDLDNRRAAFLDLQQAVINQRRSIINLQGQIDDVTARLEIIPIDKATAEAESIAAAASLRVQSTQTNASNSYLIISPVNGRVDAVLARTGEQVVPNATIVAIHPENSALIAELYVPSRAAGFIKPGQEVKIKYQAFPFQRFGVGKSKIKTVSVTVLAPNEVRIPGVQFQEPVFRVIAILEKEEIEAYGEIIPLRSGMLVNADIVVDRRNLIEWLLDPLYAAGVR